MTVMIIDATTCLGDNYLNNIAVEWIHVVIRQAAKYSHWVNADPQNNNELIHNLHFSLQTEACLYPGATNASNNNYNK